MKNLVTIITAATLFTASCALPAAAQMVCGARGVVVGQLTEKHGETVQSYGLQHGRGVVEVFANVESGSWTIIVTNLNGKTCLMAAGDNYENIPNSENTEGEDS